jgi:hypothetical protein
MSLRGLFVGRIGGRRTGSRDRTVAVARRQAAMQAVMDRHKTF